MPNGQLLIIEGPDGTGKTTLARAISQGTGSRLRRYGAPQSWHRTWHDAWGLDMIEDIGAERIVHDRGVLGHSIWHTLMPNDNERLLVTAYNVADVLNDIRRHWRLRVVILMRKQAGMVSEIESRDESQQHIDRALDSIPLYYQMHRTLVDFGVNAQVWESTAALAMAPARWWEGW